MVTGSFARFLDPIIKYKTPEDLRSQLKTCLWRNLASVREVKRPSGKGVEIGATLRAQRIGAGYDNPQELAKELGISTRAIVAIESGDLRNVGIDILARIADTLGIPLPELFGELPLRPRTTRQDGNLKRLEKLAARAGWSARDYLELRDDYTKQLAAMGEPANIDEAQWRARHNALEERMLSESKQQSSVEQKSLF
jgi:transcriptional regulator with XRE-family HTH domain